MYENLEKSPDHAQEPASAKVTAPPPNPFDPASLRIDPADVAALGVKKVRLHVAVRKPSRQEFVRVRPGPDHHMTMAILELKEAGETYAVTPVIANAFPNEVRMVDMRIAISRDGTLYLWPVPLPMSDGRENAWHKTARKAAALAETEWVRVSANMGAGCYDVVTALPGTPEPEWPEDTLGDLQKIVFGNGHLIDTIDHPVIQRLRGY